MNTMCYTLISHWDSNLKWHKHSQVYSQKEGRFATTRWNMYPGDRKPWLNKLVEPCSYMYPWHSPTIGEYLALVCKLQVWFVNSWIIHQMKEPLLIHENKYGLYSLGFMVDSLLVEMKLHLCEQHVSFRCIYTWLLQENIIWANSGIA